MDKTRRGLLIIVGVLMTACARPPVLTPLTTTPAPTNFPATYYQQAIARGETVLRIDTAQSLILMIVRRGGALARLGHDHVIASRDVQGYIAPDNRVADLYLPLDRLSVDESSLRAQAKMETTPSTSDIAGTRENMLTKVLETDHYPFAVVHIHAPAPTPASGAVELQVSITLHDHTRVVTVPAIVTRQHDQMTAMVDLTIKQTDFGITPFSILGGALQVLDEVKIHVALTAN